MHCVQPALHVHVIVIIAIHVIFLIFSIKAEQSEPTEIKMDVADCENRSNDWVDRDNRTCLDIADLESEEMERSCNNADIIEGYTAFSVCCGKKEK